MEQLDVMGTCIPPESYAEWGQFSANQDSELGAVDEIIYQVTANKHPIWVRTGSFVMSVSQRVILSTRRINFTRQLLRQSDMHRLLLGVLFGGEYCLKLCRNPTCQG